MGKRTVWMILIAALLVLVTGLALNRSQQGPQVQADLVAQAAPADLTGYSRAVPPASGETLIEFPRDHGPHPDYQTEWWYYTGNLQAQSDGRRFGYQLTFFRRAMLPASLAPERSSSWASSQAYMAHFALTDVDGERYQAFERLQRGAAGLSGAQAQPFEVWLEMWSVKETSPGVYNLLAEAQGKDGQPVRLELTLTERKPPVLQGDHGYSPKGPEPGQASYYYSLTHLEASGEVQVGGERFSVQGLSWMDHEYSTSALAQNQVGWDWLALQLDNDYELMVFQIRQADGSIDPFSSGSLVAPDGSVIHLTRDDFQIEVLDTWKSPRTQANYPAHWRVTVPAEHLTLEIRPLLADQELNVSYSYWEGAVQIQGEMDGAALTGVGYIELTGYSGSMGGEF